MGQDNTTNSVLITRSNNYSESARYIEIYNGTDNILNLNEWELVKQANGGSEFWYH